MDKKTKILLLSLLLIPEKALQAGTGNVSDGLLSFVLLLGFLLILLAMVHLTEFIKIRIRQYLEGIDISDLFGL